jgi:hypothetical protein
LLFDQSACRPVTRYIRREVQDGKARRPPLFGRHLQQLFLANLLQHWARFAPLLNKTLLLF